jgi:hypothetical protein
MSTEQTNVQEEALPRLDTYYWAAALIWAGLVFGADAMGILPQIGGATAWTWIFIVGGIVGLLMCLFSLNSPDYANPTTWDWIWSGLLLLLGVGTLTAFDIPWWLVLVVIGVIILVSALRRRD